MKTSLPFSLSSRTRRVCALTFALAAPLGAMTLSGCGGGSGGGSGGINVPSGNVNVTFRLVNESGNGANGRVTVQQNGTVVESADSTNNRVVFNLAPGTYNLILQINGVTTPITVTIANDAVQTFQLASGQDDAPTLGITASGVVRLNPTTGNTNLCNANTTPLTTRTIIRVRDANASDQPIVATSEKPNQTGNNIPAGDRGTFIVGNIPGPGTYFIEVVSARSTTSDPNPGQFTGRGPIFQIAQGQTSIDGIEVCANAGSFAIGDVP